MENTAQHESGYWYFNKREKKNSIKLKSISVLKSVTYRNTDILKYNI